MRADVLAVLRRFSAEYIRSRRASGDLRTRLVSVARERSRLSEGAAVIGEGERSQRLAEHESVRTALERSARAADDRVRALETVIASVVVAARDEVTARAHPVVPPDDPLRGGWTLPS